jgi:hypothetical protein
MPASRPRASGENNHFPSRSDPNGVVNVLSGWPDAHLVGETHPMRTPSAHRDQHHHFPIEPSSPGLWLYCRCCPSSGAVEVRLCARGIRVTSAAIRQGGERASHRRAISFDSVLEVFQSLSGEGALLRCPLGQYADPGGVRF